MSNHPYTVELGKISCGTPFMMVNYNGIYIRVQADKDYKLLHWGAMQEIETIFNDDGIHVPVVELATGHLFYMAKVKPCMIYPGSKP